MAKIRISELPELTSGSINTILVGNDNNVTHKIPLSVLTASVVQMLSQSTDARLDLLEQFESEFLPFSSSVHNLIIAATNEQSLGHLTTTSSFNTFTSSYQTDSASFNNRINNFTSSVAIDTSSFATTGSNIFYGDQIITSSLFVSGTTEFGGNLVPKEARGATLGTQDRPFKDIYIQSASIHIQSDTPGGVDTILSNVSGNILVSAGGMQLIGSGAFNAESASFQYVSGTIYFDSLQNTLADFSSSLDNRIKAATNEQFLGGFATTSSLNDLSTSVDSRLDTLETFSASADARYVEASETSSMAVSSSLYALTASFAISTSYAETSSYSVRTSQTDVYVKNVSGAQIDKGKVVRISGATGDNPLIVTASFLTEGQSANTLGITTENIANDSFGYVITEGILLGVNTSGMTAGQLIYLGANGTFTTTEPTAPNHGVRLGEVLREQQNNGSIYVRVDNGSELGEAHNVVDTSTNSSYGDILMKSGSVWINNSTFSSSLNSRINSLIVGSSSVPDGTISSSAQIESLGYALTSSVNNLSASIYLTDSTQSNNIVINSASAWGAFQSASSYSGSFYTTINNLSASIFLTDVTQSNNIATLSASLFSISGSSATLTSNNIFTGTNVFSGSTYFSGSVIFEDSREVIVLQSGFGTGTTNFDINSGSTFYVNGLIGNGTWNIQNFVSSSQRVTPITFVVEQGATAYSASAYTLGGTAVTVKWQNGSTPIGSANKTDVFALSVFRSGSTFNVLGSYSTFG